MILATQKLTVRASTDKDHKPLMLMVDGVKNYRFMLDSVSLSARQTKREICIVYADSGLSANVPANSIRYLSLDKLCFDRNKNKLFELVISFDDTTSASFIIAGKKLAMAELTRLLVYTKTNVSDVYHSVAQEENHIGIFRHYSKINDIGVFPCE